MRLINADALKEEILKHRKDYIDDNLFWTKLFNIIDKAPTIIPYCYFCAQAEHGREVERPKGGAE